MSLAEPVPCFLGTACRVGGCTDDRILSRSTLTAGYLILRGY